MRNILSRRKVAILIFNEVEVLDFRRPFEMFPVTIPRGGQEGDFQVYIVAEHPQPVITRNGLSVNPVYAFADCPPPDILLVPDGRGTRTEMHNPVLLDWAKAQFPRLELLLSVCTGSLVLAKAGLLEGLSATAHYGATDELRALAPTTIVCPTDRYVDNGKIVTSAGISAGIDMSLYIVSRLSGAERAAETTRYIQYDYWKGV